MKRVVLACCLGLLVASPAFARPHFIVFEEGHKQFSPDKFGYRIERRDTGDTLHLSVTMKPDAAKVFRRARLWVYNGGKLVLDADLAASDLENGGKQLLLTIAKTHLDGSQIVIHSGLYNATIVSNTLNFAGFRVVLKDDRVAEPEDARAKE